MSNYSKTDWLLAGLLAAAAKHQDTWTSTVVPETKPTKETPNEGYMLRDILGRIKESITTPPKKTVVDNGDLLAEHGLRVMHFSNPNATRKFTVAYREHFKHMVEIAVTVCHPSDIFSKKEGTRRAVEAWADGNTILVPKGKNLSASETVSEMFYYAHKDSY